MKHLLFGILLFVGLYTSAQQTVIGSFGVQIDTSVLNARTNAAIATKENSLGNPLVNGYILSSTLTGTRSWVSSSSGNTSTISRPEAMFVNIPLGSSVLHLGDSYTLSGTYIQTMDSAFNLAANNKGIAGTGVTSATAQSFTYEASTLGTIPTTIMIGLNDLRNLGSALPTIEKIKGSYRAMIANHYLSYAISANNAAVTAAGTWASITSGSLYEKAGLSLSGLALTSSVAGSTLTATLSGRSIVIGCFGTDSTQSNDGRFTVTVDGVLNQTFTPNRKNRYLSNFSNSLAESQNAIIISGLTNTAHTVVITTLDAKRTIVDYLGVFKETNLQPLVIGSIIKLPTFGYSTVTSLDNVINNNSVDSANSAILSVINEFNPIGLPITYVDGNKYLNTAVDWSSDSIHLSPTGYYKLGKTFLERFSAVNQFDGLFNSGFNTSLQNIWGSSQASGGLRINANNNSTRGNITMQTAGGFVGIGASVSPTWTLTVKSSGSQFRADAGTSNSTFISNDGSGTVIGTNRNPTSGAMTSGSVATNQIVLNSNTNNGAIDFWTTNSNGGVPSFKAKIDITGLALGSTNSTAATEMLDVNGNIILRTAGNKIKIATGTNASIGTATLAGGTVTVSTTAALTASLIYVTVKTPSGTQGFLSVPTITNATSFIINSTSATETSVVNWWIVN